jgi:hypothetical protein
MWSRVVEHSDVLMNLGGVGCLLRFLVPEAYILQHSLQIA